MEFIERYLQEVGRHLPTNKKADILTELRSSLGDTLEARAGEDIKEESVIQVLKEMGAPRKVAASYYPEGQYLIGPELYPFFQFILGIALAGSIGGQLIAAVVSLAVSSRPLAIVDQLGQIAGSVPVTLGFVVLVFFLLQRLNVQPRFDEKEFDPRALPALEKDKPVNRAERIVSIIMGIIVLGFLFQIAANGGFTAKGGVDLFTNPVLDHYFPWIAVSMVIGILLDVILLWRGRWEISTRLAKIGANLFSMFVLYLLIQGSLAWFDQMGLHSFIVAPDTLASEPENFQLIGMVSFQIAYFVAFIVTGIETLVSLYRLIRAGRSSNASSLAGMALINR